MLEEKSDNINDDLSMAKQKLNEAKKLDQNLDIEEDKQEIAQALIERGVNLVQADKIEQALIAYKTAEEFYPEL